MTCDHSQSDILHYKAGQVAHVRYEKGVGRPPAGIALTEDHLTSVSCYWNTFCYGLSVP